MSPLLLAAFCLQLDVKLTGASWGGAAAGEPVSCLLVPPLLALKSHRSPGTRAQALAVTTLMTGHMPLGLQNNMGIYIQVRCPVSWAGKGGGQKSAVNRPYGAGPLLCSQVISG